ncbi:MAG TPA: helix-turn-helix transcriptional regulator [Micromonosporaceae bacterium]|jgi:transcriptional regulator with XRE-family HTH domain
MAEPPLPRPSAGGAATQRPDTEPLWRHVLGEHLRRCRLARGETLLETAERAGVSPQYLSEMERGIKEPSSEMIAAVAGALDTSLVELTTGIAESLRTPQALVFAGRASRAAYALAA